MSGITLELAKSRLDLWLEAEGAVATRQSYRIGCRSLERVNLAEIRRQIEYWQGQVDRLTAAQTGVADLSTEPSFGVA